MKSILALLLGLSVTFADDSEKFSWDSDETSTQSYQGLVIQVYQPSDEALVITLASNEDADEVYCLNFARVFEAIYADPDCRKDCIYEIIGGSEVDLSDANCTVTERSETEFDAICNNVNGAVLTLNFQFKQADDDEYGIEYTIDLSNYTFVSQEESVKFVMEQSVKDCSVEYSDEVGESNEEDEDQSADTDADTDAETDTDARRIMEVTAADSETIVSEDEADSNSLDEEAGISSDDSREYDNGNAQFIISGTASDVCDDGETELEYYMISHDESLQIIFPKFECTLKVDPWFKLDNEKIIAGNNLDKEDGSIVWSVSGVVVMSVISLFLF